MELNENEKDGTQTDTAACETTPLSTGKAFKITDSKREVKKGVVAASLEDLTAKVTKKLELPTESEFTVVLEVDGTEIDDDEYFATLDPQTSLMILHKDEKWRPTAPDVFSFDQLDDVNCKGGDSHQELAGLVGKLKHNLCHVSLLGGPELEMLSDMDPESIVDITFPDKIFLEQLKEASGRYLSEKRQAQDAMDLLKLYHEKETAAGNGEIHVISEKQQ